MQCFDRSPVFTRNAEIDRCFFSKLVASVPLFAVESGHCIGHAFRDISVVFDFCCFCCYFFSFRLLAIAARHAVLCFISALRSFCCPCLRFVTNSSFAKLRSIHHRFLCVLLFVQIEIMQKMLRVIVLSAAFVSVLSQSSISGGGVVNW